MDKNEMLKSLRGAKSKLMAAISMLLVSAILCTNVTYTWFVLSTAPEVSGVSTTSGSNGALEIALQSTNVNGGRVEKIRNGVGDSSALVNTTAAMANVTWGNVVDVTTGYGIEDITLYPSRLNIDQVTKNVLTSNYLAVPQYGMDGRVHSLKSVDMAHYVETATGGSFEKSTNYGVNVHGFTDDMDDDSGKQVVTSYYSRESVRDEAAKKVYQLRSNMRQEMEKLITDNSVGLVNIMQVAVDKEEMFKPWNNVQINAVKNLILGAESIADRSVEAMRWALLACVVADKENYTPSDSAEMLALGEIYSSFRTLPLYSADPEVTTVMSIAQGSDPAHPVYPDLVDAVNALVGTQTAVASAKALYESKQYPLAGLALITPDTTYVMCGGEDPILAQEGIALGLYNAMIGGKDPELQMYVIEDDLYFVSGNGIADSGVFPAMAHILGDYHSEILAYEGAELTPGPQEDSEAVYKYHVKATMGETVRDYNEKINLGALNTAYESADSMKDETTGMIPVEIERSNVTAYGYSVDLAFRTSQDGNLILQQEALNRVNDGAENPAVQGGGTTMSFQLFEYMTDEQVKALMQSIYVVFMDTSTGRIYGVGVADQVNCDLDAVTATLKLYDLDTELMDRKGDGVIYLGSPRANNVITAMEADKEYYVTAVVYLNGDNLSSGTLASEALVSLVGSVNLQFTTDTNLVSMRPGSYYTVPEEGGND